MAGGRPQKIAARTSAANDDGGWFRQAVDGGMREVGTVWSVVRPRN
jgi:hypothetical protein